MKTAVIHEWLVNYAGSERVLERLVIGSIIYAAINLIIGSLWKRLNFAARF